MLVNIYIGVPVKRAMISGRILVKLNDIPFYGFRLAITLKMETMDVRNIFHPIGDFLLALIECPTGLLKGRCGLFLKEMWNRKCKI